MRKLLLVLVTLWGLAITGCSSNGVMIYLGDNESPIKVSNESQTLSQALASEGLKVSEMKYRYQPSISWDSQLVGNSRVKLTEKPTVTVLRYGKKKVYRSPQLTVAKFLKEQKIELTSEDKLQVPLDSKIKNNMVIRIDHLKPEKKQVVKSNKNNAGKTTPTIKPVQKPGKLIYKGTMKVRSTAYCHGSRTATGTKPRKGTIAVDPRVIPLGTKVWVEGYGYAIAEDTGGAIKGNIIDVYFPSRKQALKWGRRTVTIKIIK